jgi:hypothetical protein
MAPRCQPRVPEGNRCRSGCQRAATVAQEIGSQLQPPVSLYGFDPDAEECARIQTLC